MPTPPEYRFVLEREEGPPLDVVRFELHEGLSQPFRLTLELSSADPAIDAHTLLDGPVVFRILRDDLLLPGSPVGRRS